MAHIKQRSLGDGWPPAGPKNDPSPNEPTVAATQSRIILAQRFNQFQGQYVADCLAGPGNPDNFPSGTVYTIVSATPITGVG